MSGINVLSLFDGISCGLVAIERAGIEVKSYYASEIDKKAIEVSKKNHPNIIQLGNVEEWKKWDINWSEIDLLIGGSPCQGFSSSGKMLNFNDPRSRLFFVYVDILKHAKRQNPKIKFLLENVKMKAEWVQIITDGLEVEPIEINSALVSAQKRVRLYWFNWNIDAIEDRRIMLTDILEDKNYINSAAIRTRPIINEGRRKSLCLEVNDSGKSLCLVTVNLNNIVTPLPRGRYLDVNQHNYPKRVYTAIEMCRLQTLPDNYVEGYSINDVAKLVGNAWNVDTVAHIFSYMPV